MVNTYDETFVLRPRDCDLNERWRPSAILETMQDVASFVARKISCVEGVVATATHFMLKTYKLGGVSLVDEDSTDRRSMVL